MITVLGAIFSSFRIYMLIGLTVVALGLFAYIEHLRLEAADARVAVSSAQATVSETRSALSVDAATIARLQKINTDNQAALRAAAITEGNLVYERAEIRDAIRAIPKPKTCQSLDARDRTAIDGVRRLLGTPAPGPAN